MPKGDELVNGKAYQMITSSIRETLENLQEAYEEGEEAITYEDAINELVSTLESKMKAEGLPTSKLWEDCGF